jgi:hypothetical protein
LVSSNSSKQFVINIYLKELTTETKLRRFENEAVGLNGKA